MFFGKASPNRLSFVPSIASRAMAQEPAGGRRPVWTHHEQVQLWRNTIFSMFLTDFEEFRSALRATLGTMDQRLFSMALSIKTVSQTGTEVTSQKLLFLEKPSHLYDLLSESARGSNQSTGVSSEKGYLTEKIRHTTSKLNLCMECADNEMPCFTVVTS